MGISASFNLNDAALKQTLPVALDTSNADDMSMSMSMTSNLTEESVGELQNNLVLTQTKKLLQSQLVESKSRSKLKVAQDTSSLSAEEKHDLEELQKDVLLADECDIPLPKTSPAVPRPVHNTDYESSVEAGDFSQSISSRSTVLTSTCFGNHGPVLQSVSSITQCKFASSDSDDFNDFNVTQFREVNSRSNQLEGS